MTSTDTQKIGGEYGEVRANIDANKLNAYLRAHVPAVAAPVNIKQFKVCSCRCSSRSTLTPFSSLDRSVCFGADPVHGVVAELYACSLTPHTS